MTTIPRVRLATFNVLHGRPVEADGRPASMRDMPAPERPLCEAVAALDADVVALQEVDRLQERSGGVDQAGAVTRAVAAGHWRYASALHGHAVLGRGWLLDPSRPGLRVYGPDDADPDDGGPSHGVALLWSANCARRPARCAAEPPQHECAPTGHRNCPGGPPGRAGADRQGVGAVRGDPRLLTSKRPVKPT